MSPKATLNFPIVQRSLIGADTVRGTKQEYLIGSLEPLGKGVSRLGRDPGCSGLAFHVYVIEEHARLGQSPRIRETSILGISRSARNEHFILCQSSNALNSSFDFEADTTRHEQYFPHSGTFVCCAQGG